MTGTGPTLGTKLAGIQRAAGEAAVLERLSFERLADLGRAPALVLLRQFHDQLLDLEWQSVGPRAGRGTHRGSRDPDVRQHTAG